ncbi:hypothetical protein F4553_001445 [Allocatelliglobosispora scoriae]|uniref:Uncharacterized protein n=1 Tax=Allocatelliglobosispora scoriae TaxID=643052 RepID=A0A841BLE1_9ACTN|nr:AbrB/MazE/SpoVT family DNA-binding domain-containing protein [Allocatelliglobosispora scoriae]MBB5868066.1 hypothetical protein [Allocatelliglobosispora scoriae]
MLTPEVACDVTAIDKNGRLWATGLLKLLNWAPSATVALSELGGLIQATPDPRGTVKVTPEWHLRLPVPARRWHGLHPGTTLPPVADPRYNCLIIHPP